MKKDCVRPTKTEVQQPSPTTDTVLCDTCGCTLGPAEDQVGRRCTACRAERESCGCSDAL